MKILHIIAQLPSKTGSGVYFSNLIKELNKNNENYAIYGHQDCVEYDFDVIPDENKFPINFNNSKLDFHIVGMSDVMPYNSTRYKDMTPKMLNTWLNNFKVQILNAYNEIKPDIIICHHLWILTSLTLDLLRDRCDKIIGICHGTDIRQALQNPRLKNRYVKNLNRLDKVFALSENQVSEIVTTYNIDKNKIHVSGGGYNQDYFYKDEKLRYDENNQFINLVYAGKIADAKGVFELIDAYKQLDYDNTIILNIIGTPQGENIERIHKKLDNTKNIKLFNAKNQKSLAHLFRYSSIFILPSYYEGLGLVAIEALASGMYIVSTKLDALMEVLGDDVNNSNAIEYVDLPRLKNVDTPYEKDIPEFVNRLAKAIDIQVQRVKNKERISDEVLNSVAKHSWENIANEIFNEITRESYEELNEYRKLNLGNA
ncbi:glycosyltransferase family 4 protein [Miniphocaeibacter halophilus]|uniref:Glycosyltransferase n=1 Tax=Miniphocaeibacter halophilus TaxID=2931922 RepID=A0AC61MTA4_9FIRM|nr:glycosyltransferase family 4 protein [Miniphocaeibacter halophilus]QQK08862.1 glycosyltransferase [Miniphocaeibacter halophilus]